MIQIPLPLQRSGPLRPHRSQGAGAVSAALAVGGAAFGAFTTSVLTLGLAEVHGPAADTDLAVRHAMPFQVAAFTITAPISLRLRDRNDTTPGHGRSSIRGEMR
ncbi:hypothetical protein [Streptomyces sp. NPDC059272]|uniref:hypothetical protein n=1 Tax=Streptomyces sp. NPDC059272 TaxID=3346800 RepID=UPI0036CB34F9